MEPWACNGTVLDRLTEFIQLLLVLLLQLHLDESSLIFALRQDDVVPFVLKLSDFGLVSILKCLHFLSLNKHRVVRGETG